MPKRNYGFEKRQKEIAKQEKRAAKQQKRLERLKSDDASSETPAAPPDQLPLPD